MRAGDVTATLAAFERRGPGTDAERRAARRLERELRTEGYKVRLEPFWCRPNWALAHAWHVALALAGSLLSVSQPTIGAALLGAALIAVIVDGLTGVSPGRRLTPERASQNIVAAPATDEAPRIRTRLIVTANYDLPRAALIYRTALRNSAGSLRRAAGPLALGWLACLALTITWALVVAIIRATAHHPSHALGAVQLPPTVALVLALALLLEAAAAGYVSSTAGPGNAASAATAVAIADALKASPPRNLTVELLLQGAGEGQEIGMRRYLKAHRGEPKGQPPIVLGVSASGAGPPVWWRSDGRLLPLAYTRRLRDLAEMAGEGLAGPWRGRGGTPALPARAKGLPALAIGNVAAAETTEQGATERLQAFAVRLVEAIDAALEPQPENSEATPTPA